jgi:hypothetical protein
LGGNCFDYLMHFLLGGGSKASNTARPLYRVGGFLMDLRACLKTPECALRDSGTYQQRKRHVNCIVQRETNF